MDALGDLLGQLGGDLVGVLTQRHRVGGRVVGIAAGDVTNGGFGLDRDELLEVVDVEDGAGGVLDLPHDDRGDLDGVAVRVVDLRLAGLEVADPGRDPAAGVERVHPAQSRFPECARVGAAEQLQHARLVRFDQHETGEGGAREHDQDGTGDDQRNVRLQCTQHDQPDAGQFDEEPDAEHQPAVAGTPGAFGDRRLRCGHGALLVVVGNAILK